MFSITGKTQLNREKISDLRELKQFCLQKYQNRTAFTWHANPKDETVLSRTYHELYEDAAALASFFIQHKIENQTIALMGANSYFWALVYNAVADSGNIIVPLDRQLPEHEAELLLKRSKASFFFFSKKLQPFAQTLPERLPNLKTLVLLPESDENDSEQQYSENSCFSATEITTLPFTYFLNQGKLLRQTNKDLYETYPLEKNKSCALVFTSGTTSMSKGVLLSQQNIAIDAWATYAHVNLGDNIRTLSILPMHHTFESTGFLLFWLFGANIHIADGLRYISQNLIDWKITLIVGVPLLFENMHKQIERALKVKKKEKLIQKLRHFSNFLLKLKIDLRRKIFKPIYQQLGTELATFIVGAAPVEQSIVDFFTDIGILVIPGYGMTETSPVLSAQIPSHREKNSVGAPIGGVQIAIESKFEGRSPETAGEILVKGDIVMQGYYEDEEATKAVFDDQGWFHTGDIGYFDAKECLHISGRKKAMIVLDNGKKAFPEEIEFILNKIPGVNESLVWGEDRPNLPVEIVAKLLLTPEDFPATVKADDPESIQQYLRAEILKCNHLMPSYKTIKAFIWGYDDFIKTTTLKIKRFDEIDAIHQVLKSQNKNIRQLNGQRVEKISESCDL